MEIQHSEEAHEEKILASMVSRDFFAEKTLLLKAKVQEHQQQNPQVQANDANTSGFRVVVLNERLKSKSSLVLHLIHLNLRMEFFYIKYEKVKTHL